MMKFYNAFTTEVDDLELVLEELTQQIPKDSLLKNTIGIMNCNMEFIQEGITEAVQKHFGFPIAGFTTNASAVNHKGAYFALSLTVITSDTVCFAAGVSAPLTKENAGQELAQLYNNLKNNLCAEPGLLFTFAPVMIEVDGDSIVGHLDAATGGLPNFGALALDFTTEIRKPMTFLNDGAYTDRLVLVLFSNDIKASFRVASLNKDKIMPQNALITAAEGSILKEINNMPVLKYLESIGLAKDGEITGINAIPLVMDYGDGTKPIIRVVLKKVGDYVACAGAVHVNASLSVASLDHEDVVLTASEIARKCQAGEYAYMISCIGRTFALGFDHMGEINQIIEDCGDKPFLFTYSGGEICPVTAPDGRLVNRFHNNTLVSCIFAYG
jgi:hypothetical protein